MKYFWQSEWKVVEMSFRRACAGRGDGGIVATACGSPDVMIKDFGGQSPL